MNDTIFETDDDKIEKITSFDNMDLPEQLLRGIYAYGFEHPSTIQQMSIKPILEGRDLIAQAQSGTGKTAAFLVSAMSLIDKRIHEPQILILAPTRELAIQIHANAVGLNTYLKCDIGLIIGGQQNNVKKTFNDECQLIIGTPGKVFYMLSNYHLKNTNIRLFVLDEADEMLNTCFKDQIHDIFQYIPTKAQIAIFSATMNNETLQLSTKFMNNPLRILVKNEELTLEGILQFYINVEEEFLKYDVLADIYKYLSINQTIIYCNSKKKTQQIYQRLLQSNFTCSAIHSDMNQQERSDVISKFRKGQVRILLATDIIARGLDVQQVSTVINFDLPLKKEVYIHRIGRSGRYGRKGMAINFVTKNDFNYLKQIESFYNTSIEAFPDPSTLPVF
jgi:translation initiation factor 4A